MPARAEALYEATCFAADSNALEVRCLGRSGPSRIPQVQRARRAFFEKPMFVNRGIWDRNLFDRRLDTFFIARAAGGVLRLDLGRAVEIDRLVFKIKYEHDIAPHLNSFAAKNLAEVSSDLRTWIPVGSWSGKGSTAIAKIPARLPLRYVRVSGAPRRLAEIEAYDEGGKKLATTGWPAKRSSSSCCCFMEVGSRSVRRCI